MDPAAGARRKAEQWMKVAEKLLIAKDLEGCKEFSSQALAADSGTPGAEDLHAAADVLLAAQRRRMPNGHPNPYAVLGIDPANSASRHPDVVHSSYRRLSLLLNRSPPDRPSSVSVAEAARLVADAWAFLSNPGLKSTLDTELDAAAPARAYRAPAPAPMQHYQPQPSPRPQQSPIGAALQPWPSPQPQHSPIPAAHQPPPPPQRSPPPRAAPQPPARTAAPPPPLRSPPRAAPQPPARAAAPPPPLRSPPRAAALPPPLRSPPRAAAPPPPLRSPPRAAAPPPPLRSPPQAPPQPPARAAAQPPLPQQSPIWVAPHPPARAAAPPPLPQQSAAPQPRPPPQQSPIPAAHQPPLPQQPSPQRADPQPPAGAAAEPMESGTSPSPTFWTTCRVCSHIHQYDRFYEARKLKCSSCHQPFVAEAMAETPPIVPGTDMYYCTWGFFPIGFPGCPGFESLVNKQPQGPDQVNAPWLGANGGVEDNGGAGVQNGTPVSASVESPVPLEPASEHLMRTRVEVQAVPEPVMPTRVEVQAVPEPVMPTRVEVPAVPKPVKTMALNSLNAGAKKRGRPKGSKNKKSKKNL